MTSKSYSKDDLKRLMQEKQQEKLSKKRIESPLARYDEGGNLFCKICEFKIENVNLWTKHLVSKEHKLSLLRIKKRQIVEPESNEIKKRKLNEQVEETKKQRVDLIKESEDKVKLAHQISDETIEKEPNHSDTNEQSTSLPTDLPKGFFDNPEEDAKVRDEIYKDPLEAEWSNFQRTIQEEDKVIDNLTETDLVETQNYRELNEIDEQIEHWNRINELEIKRDAKKSNKKMEIDRQENQSDESSDESDLGEEFNILSNWRR